ncbi:nitrogen assimilation transcription factor nira [Colletotrichum truncatum]|uniref:Nitrogen assimilation transcription factor nira n=1 Tax=Colletotrichum truncatum TaxID=5467 RepID=A0ACC3Z0S0_COLTU
MANSIKLRPLLPLTSNGPPAPIPISTAPKRKRPQVSAACNGCRKRKVKCDGARPCCYACSISKIPCVYPVPEGLSQREAQKLKLNHMSKAHESSRRVLELLRASRDGASTEILQQLQHSEHLDETIQSIADASLLLPKLGDQGGESFRYSPNTSLRSLLAETADSGVVLPVSRWTLVSQDDQFLTQLLDIFWTWDAICHASSTGGCLSPS